MKCQSWQGPRVPLSHALSDVRVSVIDSWAVWLYQYNGPISKNSLVHLPEHSDTQKYPRFAAIYFTEHLGQVQG